MMVHVLTVAGDGDGWDARAGGRPGSLAIAIQAQTWQVTVADCGAPPGPVRVTGSVCFGGPQFTARSFRAKNERLLNL